MTGSDTTSQSTTAPTTATPWAGPGVLPQSVELRRVSMPLVRPFRTSFGTQTGRDVLLVRVVTADAEGWAECVTGADPLYSAEYTDGAAHVIEHHLLPRVFAAAADGGVRAADLRRVLGPVKGHQMAKAALELALLDAELRTAGTSLADAFGAVRTEVDCGVSVGIPEGGVDQLLTEVAGYLDDGYRRIKLKIEPGFDLDPVGAMRERFPDIALQVDANAAYTRADADHLAGLDAFDLQLVEQPLPEEDVLGHARLAEVMRTPICLDESIVSAASAADAIELGACEVVNIKIGRVGGWYEALAIHDLCVTRGIPVWCGGMLETGIGRAANVAIAALPGFTLPGDTSASARYFAQDLTDPFVLDDGRLQVPTGPGIGVTPLTAVLEATTTSVTTLRP